MHSAKLAASQLAKVKYYKHNGNRKKTNIKIVIYNIK